MGVLFERPDGLAHDWFPAGFFSVAARYLRDKRYLGLRRHGRHRFLAFDRVSPSAPEIVAQSLSGTPNSAPRISSVDRTLDDVLTANDESGFGAQSAAGDSKPQMLKRGLGRRAPQATRSPNCSDRGGDTFRQTPPMPRQTDPGLREYGVRSPQPANHRPAPGSLGPNHNRQ